MKKISILGASLLSMIALVTVMFFHSCTKDDCKDVVCLNGGTCVSGTCECPTGYEGSDCTTEERTEFLGTYTVVEDCSASNSTSYVVSIIAGTNISEVLISNMWDAFVAPVVATINGNTISIANQEPDGDGFSVQGSGTITGNIITMNYTVTDGSNGSQDNCTTSLWTK
ncbi:MAG: calcium-binding EGF-like domain-containing protein [Chitinophagales bacterium]|nr:calcium-binding EGF-like domain-containing protein [Chitinophagales bacterium]